MEHLIETRRGAASSLQAFDYALPAELIAQMPAPARDQSRLLVVTRSGTALQHATVRDLPAFLRAGDVMVFNDTRVRPARLRARTPSGGAVELLFVRALGPQQWQCLGRPAKRLRSGTVLSLPGGGAATVQLRLGGGRYQVMVAAAVEVADLLQRYGEIPLPPYIRRAPGLLAVDRERYQTAYAAHEGAVAAPTAGLHFTPELLSALRHHGVALTWLTLHVGPGTFLPIRVEDVHTHHMDAEWAHIPEETAAVVNRARREGRRVVAVGTTTVRALESCATNDGQVTPGSSWAQAFILPGFRFRIIDALLTNFHLPRSTLLMLACAFAGRRMLLDAYATAVAARYRFYSYGDAMLIV